MSEANQRQVAGDHYKSGYQHWDLVSAVLMPYLPAQTSKYAVRWKKKNGKQDLEKAMHFLDKMIEQETKWSRHRSEETEEFISANNLPIDESDILRNLVSFYSGDMDKLRRTKEILQNMLDRTDWRDS